MGREIDFLGVGATRPVGETFSIILMGRPYNMLLRGLDVQGILFLVERPASEEN